MRSLKNNGRKVPGCVNADGTAQKEAIPDEWGQAAFVSALVEGLAGVVDKSILFEEVELSPRWYFAGVNKTEMSVGYGNDGNQVSYQYTFSKNKVEIKTSGKFERFTMRVPFPDKTKSASAIINGKIVNVSVDQVNQSKYAVFTGNGSNNNIEIKFN